MELQLALVCYFFLLCLRFHVSHDWSQYQKSRILSLIASIETYLMFCRKLRGLKVVLKGFQMGSKTLYLILRSCIMRHLIHFWNLIHKLFITSLRILTHITCAVFISPPDVSKFPKSLSWVLVLFPPCAKICCK